MEISRPTLIIDQKQCERNIREMLVKAQNSQVYFRPHFKTHQSLEVARWFRSYGVKAITVSSVEMAAYFANDDWNDITIAFPFIPADITRINELSSKAQINIIIDNLSSLTQISNQLKHPVGLFIEITTGYIRSGIPTTEIEKIKQILDLTEKVENIEFEGFLCHDGHTYEARSKQEITEIHQNSQQLLKYLKSQFIDIYPNLKLSIGDTPTCSVIPHFDIVDEIRPGNFVFYDLMQLQIGSCNQDQISISMKCLVVSKNEAQKEVVIHGGAIHFSKEFLLDRNGTKIYGLLKTKNLANNLSNAKNYIARLSQEHGVVKVTDEIFHELEIGDLLEIIPVHSCLTVHNMRDYYTENGEMIQTKNSVL